MRRMKTYRSKITLAGSFIVLESTQSADSIDDLREQWFADARRFADATEKRPLIYITREQRLGVKAEE
jgi:hypothetical protein